MQITRWLLVLVAFVVIVAVEGALLRPVIRQDTVGTSDSSSSSSPSSSSSTTGSGDVSTSSSSSSSAAAGGEAPAVDLPSDNADADTSAHFIFDVDSDGANVDIDADGISVDTDGANVDIDADGISVDTGDANVDIDADGISVDTDDANFDIDADADADAVSDINESDNENNSDTSSSASVDSNPSSSSSSTADSDIDNTATATTGGSTSSDTASGNTDAACFPSEAKVELSDGRKVSMEALRIGDEVLSNSVNREYSRVHFFSHADVSTRTEMVRLEIGNTESVSLSPQHYIYLHDGSIKTAKSVRVNEQVLRNGRAATVTAVQRMYQKGLFNPHTVSGEIVVDDVQMSCYTQTVEKTVAHSLLVPLRALFRLGVTGLDMTKGSDFFARVAPSGAESL